MPTRYLLTGEGQELVRHGGSAIEAIMPRSQCLYFHLDCAKVPLNKRTGFVAMTVRRLAPFPDVGYHAVLCADGAMIWCWPKSAEASARAALGETPADRIQVLPESCFRAREQDEGAQLIGVSAGVEGRIWRRSALIASRWWPLAPDARSWSHFLRGAGVPAGAPAPEVEYAALSDASWTPQRRRWVLSLNAQLGRPFRLAVLAAIAVLLGWQLGDGIGLRWRISGRDADIATREARVSPVLDARQRAVDSADRVAELLALRPPQSQTKLLARVSDLLAPSKTRVLEWNMGSRDEIRITLSSSGASPQALVQSVEQSGVLTGVALESGADGRQLILRAQVLPEPGAATPPANEEFK